MQKRKTKWRFWLDILLSLPTLFTVGGYALILVVVNPLIIALFGKTYYALFKLRLIQPETARKYARIWLERRIALYARRHVADSENPKWVAKLALSYRAIAPLSGDRAHDRYVRAFHFASLAFELEPSRWRDSSTVLDWARTAFLAGNMQEAQRIVKTLLKRIGDSAKRLESSETGDVMPASARKLVSQDSDAARYYGNIILCRAELKRNNIEGAKRCLQVAIDSISSDHFFLYRSIDLSCVPELLDYGETGIVIAYLERCAETCKRATTWLKDKIQQIQRGDVPEFGVGKLWR